MSSDAVGILADIALDGLCVGLLSWPFVCGVAAFLYFSSFNRKTHRIYIPLALLWPIFTSATPYLLILLCLIAISWCLWQVLKVLWRMTKVVGRLLGDIVEALADASFD